MSRCSAPDAIPPAAGAADAEAGVSAQSENIGAVLDFYTRETDKISRSRRALEYLAKLNAQPYFLVATLLFVCVWIGLNVSLERLGQGSFDPFPYHLLHGIISLGALVTASVVLAKQERLARLAEQRENLDLTVTLLTEQKAAKLIELMEELRRDLPNVRDRLDATATALEQPMNPELVLAALEQPLIESVMEPAAVPRDTAA